MLDGMKPIVPEDLNGDRERRALIRACASIALGHRDREFNKTDRIARSFGDPMVPRLVKAVSSPATSADYPQAVSTVIVPMLSPNAASSRLLSRSTHVDLTGFSQIRIPMLPGKPQPIFIAEGKPIPAVNLSFGAATLGPVRSIKIVTTLTRELEEASPEAATVILGNALALATETSMDAALFSNAAGDTVKPPGILYGVTPISATAGGGIAAIAGDLAGLAKAIGDAGINPDGAIYITTPKLATKLKVLVSPLFTNEVLTTSALTEGTVICVAQGALITAYSGNVRIDIAKWATIHMEATTPADIIGGSSPGTEAWPTKSLGQVDEIGLRVVGDCAWAVAAGAISTLTGATW
jgi:hypothetical protein